MATITVNAEFGAAASDSVSLNVSTICVPSAEVAALTNVGGARSTVFVTVCAAKVAASLPPASCTAFASSLAVGSM